MKQLDIDLYIEHPNSFIFDTYIYLYTYIHTYIYIYIQYINTQGGTGSNNSCANYRIN